MNESELKAKLQELVNDFKANYKYHKEHSEANTETSLIEPLFELLGWTTKDWIKQQKVHRGQKLGRADYDFKIGDRTAFFLEVKKVGMPLDKEADKQVISYALSKRIPFAVSTNFEELKIFCVEQENAVKNVFRVFKKPEDYINDLQNLLFVSKESFEKGSILKKAEDEGRLKKRISIDKALLEDLMHIRSLIAGDIEKSYPGKYEINERDEIVQRILDRLIFIRRCEDKGISPDNLILEEIKHLPDDKAYSKLKTFFQKYNDIYNSGLFAVGIDNDCDKITINGKIIKQLIYYLYESKDGAYIYNFDWIDADVLGQVYEQYLGEILAETKSGKTKLKSGQAHRKRQGIYYTPTYIVDYIVKNTIGELLKDNKVEAKNIKILDPACGSGSFLIKAFDYLYENLSTGKEAKQKKIDSQGVYSIKTDILKNNIYGVDLDNKAVEITKLNLLLKAAEAGRKLPEEVDLHTRHGNSLIDDEKISPHSFKWKEQFKEIIDSGGFDVVIGNPPYNAELSVDEKKYIKDEYKSLKSGDTAEYFIKRATGLLKSGGVLGFIVPKSIGFYGSWNGIREDLLSNFEVLRIADVGLGFPDANLEEIIIVARKSEPMKEYDICVEQFSDLKRPVTSKMIVKNNLLEYSLMKNNNILIFSPLSKDEQEIIEKIDKKSNKFSEIIEDSFRGIYISDTDKKTLKKGNIKFIIKEPWIQRYGVKNFITINTNEKFVNQRTVTKLLKRKLIFKVLRGKRLAIHYDDKGELLTASNIVNVTIKNNANYDGKILTGLFNSSLFSFYIQKSLFSDTTESARHLDGLYLSVFPIPKVIENRQRLEKLVDEMLLLNKKLHELGDKQTSERARLEEERDRIDAEIDELVYELYGITKEEKNLISSSLK